MCASVSCTVIFYRSFRRRQWGCKSWRRKLSYIIYTYFIIFIVIFSGYSYLSKRSIYVLKSICSLLDPNVNKAISEKVMDFFFICKSDNFITYHVTFSWQVWNFWVSRAKRISLKITIPPCLIGKSLNLKRFGSNDGPFCRGGRRFESCWNAHIFH